MDDATAYMELVRANAQSELTALERGMHALHSGMDVKAYAESVGRARTSVSSEVLAARVADAVTHVGHDMTVHFKSLVEIHAAPRWLWSALVGKMVTDGMTVEATRTMVAEVKGAVEPPGWADLGAAAESIATPGHRSPSMRVFSFGYIGSGAA